MFNVINKCYILNRIPLKSTEFISSINQITSFSNMPKKNAKSTTAGDSKTKVDSVKREAIELDKDGNILINVHAKPGSKENMIQGEVVFPDQPRLDIKISARAVEGQANTELVEFLADVLDVRKSDLTLVRGMKCREKTVSLNSNTITLEQVKDKIKNEISKSKG